MKKNFKIIKTNRDVSITFRTDKETEGFINAAAHEVYSYNVSTTMHMAMQYVVKNKKDFIAWSKKQVKDSKLVDKSLLE
jgi:hypothetical protein